MATCVICETSLILRVDDEEQDDDLNGSNNNVHIDDDVHLKCNCHFHWQCLLDSSFDLSACPNCNTNITSIDPDGSQKILCNLHNEGGLLQDQDILPILIEESYLRAYPEDRRARAFLEFCAEGDIEAIVDILQNEEEEETPERNVATNSSGTKHDILRYQDQLGTMSSALHVAVENHRVEVAWLLLLLASSVDESAFPNEVMSAARDMGISRSNPRVNVDIRSLKDAEGMTAYERARDIGGGWESWVSPGTFVSGPLLKAP